VITLFFVLHLFKWRFTFSNLFKCSWDCELVN